MGKTRAAMLQAPLVDCCLPRRVECVTRREALGLAGSAVAFLAVGRPSAEPTDIVIVDGWILSPADLAGRTDP